MTFNPTGHILLLKCPGPKIQEVAELDQTFIKYIVYLKILLKRNSCCFY